MTHKELKEQLKIKTFQFELAMEAQKPHTELLKSYKELKELQYRILQMEIADRNENDLRVA